MEDAAVHRHVVRHVHRRHRSRRACRDENSGPLRWNGQCNTFEHSKDAQRLSPSPACNGNSRVSSSMNALAFLQLGKRWRMKRSGRTSVLFHCCLQDTAKIIQKLNFTVRTCKNLGNATIQFMLRLRLFL